MLIRPFIFFLLLTSSIVASSSEIETNSSQLTKQYQQYEDSLKVVSNDLSLIKNQLAENMRNNNSITKSNVKVEIQNQALILRLSTLEVQIIDYQKELKQLKNKGVNDSLAMNFSVWTGILLASVAVIVTILGVVIAIGSIFGYKKIMDSSRREAERVAKNEANEVARNEISNRIDNGEFNDLVMQAVDRVAFGNINSNDEFDRQEVGQ